MAVHKNKETFIAELIDESVLINETQVVLDLMGEASHNSCYSLIISEKNLHPDFFRLKTGLAGDILQKFSTYNMRLAITGDFSKYESKSLKYFIFESNRGNRIFFVTTREEAFKRFIL